MPIERAWLRCAIYTGHTSSSGSEFLKEISLILKFKLSSIPPRSLKCFTLSLTEIKKSIGEVIERNHRVSVMITGKIVNEQERKYQNTWN